MSNIYDIGIIGAGPAGLFGALRINENNPNLKVIILESGSYSGKRRLQMRSFSGLMAVGDTKLWISDLQKVINKTSIKQAKSAYSFFNKIFSQIESINPFVTTKDKLPLQSLRKKLEKDNYKISTNDFIQLVPKDMHAFSKFANSKLEVDNIFLSCNNEVISIVKNKGIFIINSEHGEYKCKKILFSPGRSGWRFSREIFNTFGLIDQNEIAQFGIKVELPSDSMHQFNGSNCVITKDDNLIIGSFSNNGTVIPEDHDDMAITSFRSNEDRWASDKVSFNIIGNRHFPGNGFEQTDRIAKLTFVMSNDRILKEKVSNIINKKSKISIIKEYNWLQNTIEELTEYIPDLQTKGYFYVPTILPFAPKINITKNLESEIVDNFFVSGESCGESGIVFAALTGIIAADAMVK